MVSEEMKSTTTTTTATSSTAADAGHGERFTTPIKTVVVLVQENRSFDHMLGWMKKTLNRSDIDGVTSTDEFSNPLNTSDPNSRRVFFRNESVYVDPDPGHSIQAIYEQVFGEPWSEESAKKKLQPTMQGFAQNANRIKQGMDETVMNGFEPEKVPVYSELVSQFAICDKWFASMPASTQPNRLFIHSATSHGLTSNDTKILIEGLPQKTIFESLDEAGYSFGIYYQYPPSTLFYRNLRKLKYLTNFHQFDLSFKSHCKSGTLPNYVVIEQRYFDLKILPGNDDHPSHDVSEGQKFVKEVYESLRSSPQWDEILFIITYDEHGGFFDHVTTPTEGVPNPDGIIGSAPYYFKFDRLGVRVPAIFISPWIEAGSVLHEPVDGPELTSQFEHSSIPATIKKLFNLKEFLTKRDAWAGTFEVIINRKTPRTDCPLRLPEPVKLRDTPAREEKKLSDFQMELVQMAACLKGDHEKDSYPDRFVESMTVADAAKYVHEAFQVFVDKCRKEGGDDDKVEISAEGVDEREQQKEEEGDDEVAISAGSVDEREKQRKEEVAISAAPVDEREKQMMKEEEGDEVEISAAAVKWRGEQRKGEGDEVAPQQQLTSAAAVSGNGTTEREKESDMREQQRKEGGSLKQISAAVSGGDRKQDEIMVTRRKRSFVHKVCSCLACV